MIKGGNIGLFTGCSIISMIEAAFWLWRLCLGLCWTREKTRPASETELEPEPKPTPEPEPMSEHGEDNKDLVSIEDIV